MNARENRAILFLLERVRECGIFFVPPTGETASDGGWGGRQTLAIAGRTLN
jgi:hypothetical protein